MVTKVQKTVFEVNFASVVLVCGFLCQFRFARSPARRAAGGRSVVNAPYNPRTFFKRTRSVSNVSPSV